MWLHTYGNGRFYIDGENKPSKIKTQKRKEDGRKEKIFL